MSWLLINWSSLVFPLLVFLATLLLGLWVRTVIHKIIRQKGQKSTWTQKIVIETLWHSFILWFLFLGIYLAIQISILPATIKRFVGEGIASIFVFSLMWAAISLGGRLIRFYLGKVETMQAVTSLTLNLVRSAILIVGILTILDIWGAPTQPVLLLLVTIILIGWLILRNTIDNLLAALDIIYGEHIKLGQLIKLESGELGHVTHISWTKTMIKTTDGNLVIIPNDKLMSNIIVNYGITTNLPADEVQKEEALNTTKLIDTLSDREREVLKLIGSGATNREIAQKLIISEHTVKSHLRSILNKLNIRNRQQAAVYAEREGLISESDKANTNASSEI